MFSQTRKIRFRQKYEALLNSDFRVRFDFIESHPHFTFLTGLY